jgi:hypothetical protein
MKYKYYKLDGTIIRKVLTQYQNYDVIHKEWFDIGYVSMADVDEMCKKELTEEEVFLDMI